MSELKICVNTTSWASRQARARAAGFTNMVGDDYGDDRPMLFVPLGDDQALRAFPKFGTWGIGFEEEVSVNTNLPWKCESQQILDHIFDNSPTPVDRDDCLNAIELLKGALPWVAEQYGISLDYDPREDTLRRYPGLSMGAMPVKHHAGGQE